MGTDNSNQGWRPEGGLPWVFLCQSRFGCHDTCVKAWCNKSLVPKLICCHSLYICHCLHPTQQLWSTRTQRWQAINWTMQIIPDVTIRYTVPLLVLLLMLTMKDSMSKIRNDRQHQNNTCILSLQHYHTECFSSFNVIVSVTSTAMSISHRLPSLVGPCHKMAP